MGFPTIRTGPGGSDANSGSGGAVFTGTVTGRSGSTFAFTGVGGLLANGAQDGTRTIYVPTATSGQAKHCAITSVSVAPPLFSMELDDGAGPYPCEDVPATSTALEIETAINAATGKATVEVSGTGPFTLHWLEEGTEWTFASLVGCTVSNVTPAGPGQAQVDTLTITASTYTYTVTLDRAVPASWDDNAFSSGGSRATWEHADSRLLGMQASSASGDALAGWTLRAGVSETLASAFTLKRPGDQTGGPIVLEVAEGVTLTFSNNGDHIIASNYCIIQIDGTITCSNGTKTSSVGVKVSAAAANTITSIRGKGRITACGQGIVTGGSNAGHVRIRGTGTGRVRPGQCLRIDNCTSNGINIASGTTNAITVQRVIADHNGGAGLLVATASQGWSGQVEDSVFAFNTSHGISQTGTANIFNYEFLPIMRCVIHGNGGSGYSTAATSTSVNAITASRIQDTQFTNNAGAAIAMGASQPTAACMTAVGFRVENCNDYGNGSAVHANIASVKIDCVSTPPRYRSLTGLDFASPIGVGDGYSGSGIGAPANMAAGFAGRIARA